MTVALTIDGPLARLVLDRPDKLNALDVPMIDALTDRCREVERSAARVVLLSGRGKAFCAGGDIEAWSSEGPHRFGRHWIRDGHAAFDALARLCLPVIALLDGHALGGGLELAACADLRIAERHIKVGLPETGLGVVPGWSGTQRAVRRFGVQTVRRMALFGEIFTADEALALGIVDQVTDTGGAEAAAAAVIERLLARSPTATELTKMLLAAAEGEERERVAEAFAGTLAAASPDLAEGLAAFRARRKPDFR
ncbi:MAG: enoyl-CoA hydratase/isomerase family protein [Acuticoccus sp.]